MRALNLIGYVEQMMTTLNKQLIRHFKMIAIFAAAFLSTACGDEGMIHDEDEFGTVSHHLEANSGHERAESHSQNQVDDRRDTESEEADEPVLEGDRRLDSLGFDVERHQIELTTEIGNRLELDQIERFGLDCQADSEHCAPSTESNLGSPRFQQNFDDPCEQVVCEDGLVCIDGACQ